MISLFESFIKYYGLDIVFRYIILFALIGNLFAQSNFPNNTVRLINNEKTNLHSLTSKVSFVSFWATWCKPCKQELENIHEVYEDWQDETGVKLIAISLDDGRNTSKIKPLVNAMGWDYEVYQDSNREFATKMGVKPIHHTFLLDKDKKIIWEHVTYSDGDEDELYEKIIEISK